MLVAPEKDCDSSQLYYSQMSKETTSKGEKEQS